MSRPTATLLDANVLLALAWPNHVQHERASEWFAANQRRGWATCPITQSAFVRVSSNKAIIPEARTPRECLLLLREIVALPHHQFWEDDTALATTPHLAEERLVGHRQVTDAHLLALTLRRGGRLATFDRGLAQIVPRGRDPKSVVTFLAD